MTETPIAEARGSATTTSHDQTRAQQRKLTTSRATEIVKDHPGHTCGELAQITGEQRTMLARRLPDAANLKKPKLFKGAPRACGESGKSAFTWWPLPVPTQNAA